MKTRYSAVFYSKCSAEMLKTCNLTALSMKHKQTHTSLIQTELDLSQMLLKLSNSVKVKFYFKKSDSGQSVKLSA